MSDKNKKPQKLKARLPRGFVDREAADIRAANQMMETIREVYERYGFDPIETPLFEYTDALGKFLPDSDRPNEGVFSLQDDDDQWMSLRYDLTAPMARHVAENFQEIQLPFRTYRAGYVFRNEKPGPGRFRQFMQFDADTVGAPGVQSDAEMCMMMADTLEALGIKRGDYVIRVNNRKVFDGVLDSIGLSGDENAAQRLNVLRAIDKLDKFGLDGVKLLLGAGRKDDSGDFTRGAGLNDTQIQSVLSYLSDDDFYPSSDLYVQGQSELMQIEQLVTAAGYQSDRIKIDPSVIRGLEYYTGPVYEAELTFDVTNEKGEKVVFGSVGGGGRYDGLVSRFMGQPVPATGFS
ncbi:MAG: histidine--tRNA ligase, partial [Allorhizobium sp.]